MIVKVNLATQITNVIQGRYAPTWKIDHHILEITEKGTALNEGVEIDDEQKVKIFRVPAHTKNVPAEDVFYDFKMGVTVIKILSKKACYIYTKMGPSLPSPQKMKADIKQPSGVNQDFIPDR